MTETHETDIVSVFHLSVKLRAPDLPVWQLRLQWLNSIQ